MEKRKEKKRKGKRDLLKRQKRPILKAKETYSKVKRDLF